ncbi:MAG: hypothetical protein NVS9B9_27790 [Ktedonobacteraceae bacterium]
MPLSCSDLHCKLFYQYCKLFYQLVGLNRLAPVMPIAPIYDP